MKDPCYIFCHGWGFDASFWNNLKPFFPDQNCFFLDQGYFSTPYLDLPDFKDHPIIGVGHSLGLAKLLELPIKFTALVGIQSFINFIGYSEKLAHRRSLELQAMIQFFKKNPEKTLLSFYEKCGASCDLEKFKMSNFERLLNDLESLKLDYSLPTCPILILGAKNDVIVSPELLLDNFEGKKNVTLIFHEQGFHNLGNLEPEFVYCSTKNFS